MMSSARWIEFASTCEARGLGLVDERDAALEVEAEAASASSR
jgi:hypothetical protein